MTTQMDESGWKVLKEQSQMLVKSGFLPPSIKSVEQAIAVALKGHELGLPMMTSFSLINIIQGKPTVSAEGMLALIHTKCKGAVIDFIKIEEDCCVIEASRPGAKKHTFKFDLNDAKSAGLLSRQQWKQYPRAMFRSRCVSEMARTLFPDAIMGCSYTPEEIAPDMPSYMNEDIPLGTPTYHSSVIEDVPNNVTQISKSTPPVKRVFDKSRDSHITRLNKMLDEKGVEKEGRDKIYEKMDGKPSAELDKVLTEYYNEVFSKDLEDDFEIPFAPTPSTESNPVEDLQQEGEACTAKQ